MDSELTSRESDFRGLGVDDRICVDVNTQFRLCHIIPHSSSPISASKGSNLAG